jgi:hypothetical protein
LDSIVGVFGSELSNLTVPERGGSSEILFVCIEILLCLLEFSLTLKSIFKLFSSVGFISESEIFSFKGNDFVLELDFSSGSSS